MIVCCLLELVHSKVVIALVALEFLPAGGPRNDFKLALRLAFWAFAINRLSGHLEWLLHAPYYNAACPTQSRPTEEAYSK